MIHPNYDYCNCVDSWEHSEVLRGLATPKLEDPRYCARCSWDPCLCGEWERKYPLILEVEKDEATLVWRDFQTYFRVCSWCSATVPSFDKDMKNHEEWHKNMDWWRK